MNKHDLGWYEFNYEWTYGRDDNATIILEVGCRIHFDGDCGYDAEEFEIKMFGNRVPDDVADDLVRELCLESIAVEGVYLPAGPKPGYYRNRDNDTLWQVLTTTNHWNLCERLVIAKQVMLTEPPQNWQAMRAADWDTNPPSYEWAGEEHP